MNILLSKLFVAYHFTIYELWHFWNHFCNIATNLTKYPSFSAL